ASTTSDGRLPRAGTSSPCSLAHARICAVDAFGCFTLSSTGSGCSELVAADSLTGDRLASSTSSWRSYSARSFASIWRRSRSRRSCSSCRKVLRVTGLSVGTHRLERRNRSNRRRRAAASCSATAFSSRDPHTLCGGAISSGVAYSTTLPVMVFSNRTGKLIVSQVVADVGGGRSIIQQPLRHVPYERDRAH